MSTSSSKNLRSLAFVSLGLAISATSSLLAQTKAVDGRVSHVTLYRGQAMVTRTIPLAGPKGATEIVVGHLPVHIVPNSLYAEGEDGIEVRAVRLHTRAVRQEPREQVREIQKRIAALVAEISKNTNGQQLLRKRDKYLDTVEAFIAKAAQAELAKGSLNAETLEKTTRFVFEQRGAISAETHALTTDAQRLTKQLALEKRRLAELTTISTKTVREAVLFLDKGVAGNSRVRLTYLVAGCGWSPSYTVRAGANRKRVRVDYNALIQQMTGEDWSDVNLTLSTASPALSSASPGLAPFHVLLAAATPGAGHMEAKKYRDQLRSIRGRQGKASEAARNAQHVAELNAQSWLLNLVVNDYQSLELTSSPEVLNMLQRDESAPDNGPSLSYRLHGTVSLASRADQQMVRISQSSLASDFYHVAKPVLTELVFREAEITNDSPDGFLAGPTTVYLDGRFVGRSEMPTVARGERFVIGFGTDSQLRTRRELISKDDKVQGGNRELTLKYRLVVENYKNVKVALRVFDRLPYMKPGAIRITLLAGEDRLSKDRLYLRDERSKWILRWDEDIPAGASGEKAHMIEYAYSAEFDRKFLIAAASVTQQFQQEFEKLQRGRNKR